LRDGQILLAVVRHEVEEPLQVSQLDPPTFAAAQLPPDITQECFLHRVLLLL